MARIAVITDDPGWHGKRLKEALKREGHEAVFLSLTECTLIIEDRQLPIRMKGFEDGLPEGVFVRGIPGGSLEQVTFYLDVLHGLERLGITVYNGARAIERTVDKAMTSFMLHQAAIPTPAVWVTRDEAQALAIAEREIKAGHGVVQKPLFGSQGIGLRRYQQLDELSAFSDDQGIFYLQRYVDSGETTHDFRVFVIGGKAVAAMRRSGVSWLNNVHQGALCEAVHLDDIRLSRLAEEAVAVLEMAYAGVDIIRDRHGRYFILEVNSIPAWKGLQTVTPIAVAERLVDDFLLRTELQTRRSQSAG
ncbi:MAG: RimK family alpha-L-glutamate ligase [Gammaproteobacteria bacterium]|nr:RimK family alpha-L-glutamate ligase [Gammaproteobacteria bacterium]NDE33413.1 RimK family alpha-L-glutamate ligase [Gammaproteobacteria bacterium]NDE55496.1 RimK family alpha-L-glutamate ligase [Gammaproteobacteria bacterium]NDG86659.1 RimK family alpha-L-glutamate ligase [Gammaproteobacteria bacterium]